MAHSRAQAPVNGRRDRSKTGLCRVLPTRRGSESNGALADARLEASAVRESRLSMRRKVRPRCACLYHHANSSVKSSHKSRGVALPFYRVRLKNGIDEPKRIYPANDRDHALLLWSGHQSLEEASQRLGLSVEQYSDMFIVEETSAPPTA
jgi:hypothetical protein